MPRAHDANHLKEIKFEKTRATDRVRVGGGRIGGRELLGEKLTENDCFPRHIQDELSGCSLGFVGVKTKHTYYV